MRLKIIMLAAIGAFIAISILNAEEKSTDKLANKFIFKEVNGKKLDLKVYYPKGHKKSYKTPAIVFFFGGGWVKGSQGHLAPFAKYYAQKGFVTMTPLYRTEGSDNVPPYECLADAKSAMRWVRSHASELGIDPDKIIASGGSAGGHLAAATALVEGFDAPSDDMKVSCKPCALILFNPVIDNGPDGYGYERVKEKYKQFSPIHNIAKGTPPTLILVGTKDCLVPVRTTKKFQKLMEEAGSECEVIFYEGQKHGFFNYKKGENKYYYQCLEAIDAFLKKLGYLK